MKLTKSILMGTGALVVAGSLALVAPRAAHAIAAAAVLVENTTASPVPNKDVDQPARNAFVQTCSGAFFCSMTPAVPAGNVFVVQTINVVQELATATNAAATEFDFSNGSPTRYRLPATPDPNFPTEALTLVNATAYVSAGVSPDCSAATQISSISCIASGYLVTVP